MARLHKIGDREQGDDIQKGVKSHYFHPSYIRSLDGIRGVSILLVLFTHLGLLGPNAGFLGVNAFFVLSGFLITWLLISEWDESNALNLKAFYCRRALRLFPALFTMLISFMIYTCLTNSPQRIGKEFHYVLEALFYFTNWGQILERGQSLNLIAHTWSLSIEEQFYLLWPLILLFLLRNTRSRASLLWWTVLATICFALLRVVYVALNDPFLDNYWRLARGLDTRADSLLTGCCIGVAISIRLIPRGRWMELILMFASGLSIFGFVWLVRHYLYDPWMYCAGWFLASLFTGTIILQLAFTSRSVFHWIFESPPLVYIGTISYGLYVWHFPIFGILRSYYPENWRLVAILATTVITLLSYYLIECPCLRLKRHFHDFKTSKNR